MIKGLSPSSGRDDDVGGSVRLSRDCWMSPEQSKSSDASVSNAGLQHSEKGKMCVCLLCSDQACVKHYSHNH